MNPLLIRRRGMMKAIEPLSDRYLTFTATEDNSSISLTIAAGAPTTAVLEYSLNGGSFMAYTVGNVISLNSGDYIKMKRVSGVVSYLNQSSKYYKFVMTGTIEASGNIMSLIDASCESLTAGQFCFYQLFHGCTSLTTAPEMPATSLQNGAYYMTFYNCNKLIIAPELPALTVPQNGYRQTFQGCSRLKYVKTYMNNISASNCLLRWLDSVASTGTFVCDRNLNITTGANGIPNGWTRVDL